MNVWVSKISMWVQDGTKWCRVAPLRGTECRRATHRVSVSASSLSLSFIYIVFHIEEDISSLSCTSTTFLQLAVKLHFFTICIRLQTEAAILFFQWQIWLKCETSEILSPFYSMRFQTFIWDCVLSLLSLRFASLGSALLPCLIKGDSGSRSEVTN